MREHALVPVCSRVYFIGYFDFIMIDNKLNFLKNTQVEENF